MSENQVSSFHVNNPALAAAFTPFVAITPIMFVGFFRDLAETWKIVCIIGYIIFIMLMVAAMVSVAKKVDAFVLDGSGIRIGKREYSSKNMDHVNYNKKTKYVRLYLKSGMDRSAHLKDQQDEERFIAVLQQWTHANGIKLTIHDK